VVVAFLPAAASAHVLSMARLPVVLRATTSTMKVQSWYDQGSRLTVESWYDQGSRLSADRAAESSNDDGARSTLPVGMSESAAFASPQLVVKALGYEADIAELRARLDAFPKKEGTMVGILQKKLTISESMLTATLAMAAEAAPQYTGQRREAYFCNDQGCWVAEQYFCDETGCYIMGDAPLELPYEQALDKEGLSGKVFPTPKKQDSPQKVIVQAGIFAPAVKMTAQVMGRKELNAFRASVIAQHTKVISAFVDTSESQFGQIALKALFDAADKDNNGTLDKEEVKEALQALGFTFIEDKQIDVIFKRADSDKNEVIDFEEFVKETPKTLRTSLVKLAKQNGHDLGFLA